ncbi:unnamed protein product [Didymodactylos carnosus]|uniref:Myb-like domain-containing protein n=1 Tax=Didymodactylos carnosus TaxID=1234261 RepID=A0A814XQC7_9BILA|nr:unnamed protein product [Didymodactylos carnosus]CAF3982017.1 unnamed protein product [Didymodactylos carnosus]
MSSNATTSLNSSNHSSSSATLICDYCCSCPPSICALYVPEFKTHAQRHPNAINKFCDMPLYDGEKQWLYSDEIYLLETIESCGLGNWVDVGQRLKRSADECRQHFEKLYLKNGIWNFPFSECQKPQLKNDISSDKDLSETQFINSSIIYPPMLLSTDKQRLLTYMPARDEYEREYFNEAENRIPGMTIDSDEEEDELLKEAKLALIRGYGEVLRRRFELKDYVRDYACGLTYEQPTLSTSPSLKDQDGPSESHANGTAMDHDERSEDEPRMKKSELHQISRFLSADEYERLVYNHHRILNILYDLGCPKIDIKPSIINKTNAQYSNHTDTQQQWSESSPLFTTKTYHSERRNTKNGRIGKLKIQVKRPESPEFPTSSFDTKPSLRYESRRQYSNHHPATRSSTTSSASSPPPLPLNSTPLYDQHSRKRRFSYLKRSTDDDEQEQMHDDTKPTPTSLRLILRTLGTGKMPYYARLRANKDVFILYFSPYIHYYLVSATITNDKKKPQSQLFPANEELDDNVSTTTTSQKRLRRRAKILKEDDDDDEESNSQQIETRSRSQHRKLSLHSEESDDEDELPLSPKYLRRRTITAMKQENNNETKRKQRQIKLEDEEDEEMTNDGSRDMTENCHQICTRSKMNGHSHSHPQHGIELNYNLDSTDESNIDYNSRDESESEEDQNEDETEDEQEQGNEIEIDESTSSVASRTRSHTPPNANDQQLQLHETKKRKSSTEYATRKRDLITNGRFRHFDDSSDTYSQSSFTPKSSLNNGSSRKLFK